MITKLFIGHLLSILLLVVVVFSYRYRWLSFEAFAVVFGIVLLIVLAYGVIHIGIGVHVFYKNSSSFNTSTVMGGLFGLVTLLLLGLLVIQAKRVPVLHDITTDTLAPPVFQHASTNRNQRFNTLDYPLNTAQLQREAYPDIQPLFSVLPKQQTFMLALAVAREQGWRIEFSDSKQGIIEASDTSRVFRFIDDIAIRITDEDTKRRIDLRSVSQVGKSDLGANAKRIRNYMQLLNLALETSKATGGGF